MEKYKLLDQKQPLIHNFRDSSKTNFKFKQIRGTRKTVLQKHQTDEQQTDIPIIKVEQAPKIILSQKLQGLKVISKCSGGQCERIPVKHMPPDMHQVNKGISQIKKETDMEEINNSIDEHVTISDDNEQYTCICGECKK
jgi:hypothetical protein